MILRLSVRFSVVSLLFIWIVADAARIRTVANTALRNASIDPEANENYNEENNKENNDGFVSHEGIEDQIKEKEEHLADDEVVDLPTSEKPPTTLQQTNQHNNKQGPISVPAPPSIVSVPAFLPPASTTVAVTDECGSGGRCCKSDCDAKSQYSYSSSPINTDIAEINQAIEKLYDRAKEAKLLVDASPEIKTIDDANAALDHLESSMKSSPSQGISTTLKQIPVAPKESHVGLETENEKNTSVEEDFSPELETSVLLQTANRHVEFPRFVQNDDSEVEDALNEAKEAEDEADAREDSLNNLEENVDNTEEENGEKDIQENEKSQNVVKKKLSPDKAKKLLESQILTLENIINDVVSSNSGVRDLLGTQQRISMLKKSQKSSQAIEKTDETTEESEINSTEGGEKEEDSTSEEF